MAIARLVFAAIVFAASLVAVLPALTYKLWMASIAATEWGHYLALIALLVFLPGWRRSLAGRISAAFGAAAILLAISPVIRALPVATALPAELDSAFGSAQPRSQPGALPLSRPLRLSGLFTKPQVPGVRMTTETYAVRDGRALELDVYRRDDGEGRKPLVITIHGGSWMGGARTDLPELNSYLAARGYVAVSIGYRFAPAFNHPAQTEDVNAAIDYLKAKARRLGADSTRVALVGRSAGGQLALLSAYTKNDPSIRGVVSFYGPTDQKWGWDNPTDRRVYDSFATLRSFLGGSPEQNPEGYKTSSPLNYVGPSTVPTLLIHGTKDELVSVKQSARLDSALRAARRPHLLVEFPWATHGCDFFINGPCWQISTFAIERFLSSIY